MSKATEAQVRAAMGALGCKRAPDPIDPETLSDVCEGCSITEEGWRVPWDDRGCRVAVKVADAVVESIGPFMRVVKSDRVFEYIDDNPEGWFPDEE